MKHPNHRYPNPPQQLTKHQSHRCLLLPPGINLPLKPQSPTNQHQHHKYLILRWNSQLKISHHYQTKTRKNTQLNPYWKMENSRTIPWTSRQQLFVNSQYRPTLKDPVKTPRTVRNHHPNYSHKRTTKHSHPYVA